jgi:hypothetical protein
MKLNSGLADSPFFAPLPAVAEPATPEAKSVKTATAPTKPSSSGARDTVIPRYRDTTLEYIQARVREFGKEAATYRFTAAEKQALSKLIYAYRGRGVRTTENEVVRIALNTLLEDHQSNGEQSLLAKVLRHLRP